MSYVKPEDVKSPKSYWRLHRVLHDGEEDSWSAAEGQWENDEGSWDEPLAIRWNGGRGGKIGSSQSHGHATLFIVPPELEDAVRKAITSLPTWTGLRSAEAKANHPKTSSG